MSTPQAPGKSTSVGLQSPALRLLAWIVFLASLLFSLSGLAVSAAIYQYDKVAEITFVGIAGGPHPAVRVVMLTAPLLTAGVALVILLRSTNWRIGCLLAAFGGLSALYHLTTGYTVYAFKIWPGATLPLQWPAAWFQSWSWFLILAVFLYWLPQIFPTGVPLSPRWRVVSWLTLAFLIFALAGLAFGRAPLPNELEGMEPAVMNPYGIITFAILADLKWLPGALRQAPMGQEIWHIPVVITLLVVFSLLSMTSLALRFRRSRGDERQQLKWIAYALTLIAATFWASALASELGSGVIKDIIQIVVELSAMGLPLAIGVSILKYRLYDIDRLINRTLVYAALTGALALIYFGSVVLLQQVFPSDSPIAIVLSTLAIAALFSPLRRRIQETIDKRFYRRKYDAQRTLAAFSLKMRDEVELERLSETLLGVVDKTMQPAHRSLWLKEDYE